MAGAIDVSRRTIASHSLDGEQVSPRGVEEVEVVHLAQPVVGRRDRRVGVERVVIVVGASPMPLSRSVMSIRVAGADAVVEIRQPDQVRMSAAATLLAVGSRFPWHGLDFAPPARHGGVMR